MAERTCIGCGRSGSRESLIRVVAFGDQAILDPLKVAPGRGAWLCPELSCFERAVARGAFSRALWPRRARARSGSSPASAGQDRLQEEFVELIGQANVCDHAQVRRDTSGEGSGI